MDIQKIKDALSGKILPTIQNSGETKLASVLVIIYGSEPKILMTEKPKNLRIHAGEIAFPGGKLSEDDSDLLDTALRETREEINLRITRAQVVGQLESVITLNSGFTILPFVSVLDDIPKLYGNSEVETILHIPLIPFLKTLADDKDPAHNIIEEMYTFNFQGKIIWGASARILKQIVSKISNL